VTVGSGLDAGAITTLVGLQNLNQLAYKGHPLYYFPGDVAPGDIKGQNLDGVWFALDAHGSPVKG
jgi:predicted lipoprotein with Yx(FWY)xxD motif